MDEEPPLKPSLERAIQKDSIMIHHRSIARSRKAKQPSMTQEEIQAELAKVKRHVELAKNTRETKETKEKK